VWHRAALGIGDRLVRAEALAPRCKKTRVSGEVQAFRLADQRIDSCQPWQVRGVNGRLWNVCLHGHGLPLRPPPAPLPRRTLNADTTLPVRGEPKWNPDGTSVYGIPHDRPRRRH
jgi:hypothetical protein